MHIDVEIDVHHAALRRPVLAAGEPGTIAHSRLAHPREIEAPPLAAWRQTRLAFAAELKGQDLLVAFGVADDVRTQLAIATVVDARDLLFLADGLAKKLVGRARHRHSAATGLSS